MNTAMDVGIVVKVTLGNLLYYRLGFLGGGGIVEIDERMTIDPAV